MFEEDPFEAAAPWWRRKSSVMALLALAGLIWWFALRPAPAVWLPGQHVEGAPEQQDTDREPWEVGDHVKITPLADYRLEARVLSREDYRDDLSPVDFALGWGEMSEQSVLDHLRISQSGRWYHYSWKNPPPIPVQNIIRQSANTHIVPANEEVAATVDDVREGDRVRMSGVLIAVQKPNGFRWRSSTTRNDSGDGSCELFWVEHIQILSPASQ